MCHVTEGLESNKKGEASLESKSTSSTHDTIAGLSRSLDKYTALISQCQVITKLYNAQAVNYTAMGGGPHSILIPKNLSECVLQNWEGNWEENTMMSLSNSEANPYLISNVNVWP